jgi:2-isopropylmalate synthase
MEVWQPTPERKIILNLPDTVEVAMPNVYADQIEWFCRNRSTATRDHQPAHAQRPRHRRRGDRARPCWPGRTRVEGTLFGNGERTGNLDIVTVALNLYMHGIDPGLDFSDMNARYAMSTSAAPA